MMEAFPAEEDSSLPEGNITIIKIEYQIYEKI